MSAKSEMGMTVPLLKSILMAGLLATGSIQSHAQGTIQFQNLDFENAVTVPIPGDPLQRIQFAPAFPGWVGYAGTNEQGAALYNTQTAGSVALGLAGPGWSDAVHPIIEGNYSAVLQAGYNGIERVPAIMAQTALIPTSALTLRVKASPLTGGEFSTLDVAVSGQSLSLSPLATTPAYILYAGDISAFAGQVREIRFSAVPTARYAFSGFLIDSISFSDQSIPEPNTIVLFGLAGLSFLCRRGKQD